MKRRKGPNHSFQFFCSGKLGSFPWMELGGKRMTKGTTTVKRKKKTSLEKIKTYT